MGGYCCGSGCFPFNSDLVQIGSVDMVATVLRRPAHEDLVAAPWYGIAEGCEFLQEGEGTKCTIWEDAFISVEGC